MSKIRSLGILAVTVLLCVGVGVVSGLVTTPEIATWYAALVKPSWTPPNWAFPVAWNLLYVMMGVALWRLIVHAPVSAARTRALMFFAVQLALNAAWSPVFFKWHMILAGLIVIVSMWLAIAATIWAARQADRPAAWLLAPYLAWVTYAATLNAGILALNPPT